MTVPARRAAVPSRARRSESARANTRSLRAMIARRAASFTGASPRVYVATWMPDLLLPYP